MKKTILLGIFLLTFSLLPAQSAPWFQIGNEWTYDLYIGWNPVSGLHRFVILDEVSLGADGSWMRIRRSHPSGDNLRFYYARQVGERVYTRDGPGHITCIYDFGMVPGDTLNLGTTWNFYTVEDTGTVVVAGRQRRTQTIRHINLTYPLLLVEGIGPVGNPQEPGSLSFCSFFFLNNHFCNASSDGMSAYFRCFADANGVYAPFSECLVSADEAEPTGAVLLWPNPANEALFVQGVFRKAELIDIYGRIVATETTLNNDQIEIRTGTLPNGTYWLRCQTERGDMAVRKVVVVH